MGRNDGNNPWTFTLLLTEEEQQQIEKWLRDQGYTKGGYVRRHLLDVSAPKETP